MRARARCSWEDIAIGFTFVIDRKFGTNLCSPAGMLDFGALPTATAMQTLWMPTFELQFPAEEIEALASRFGYLDETRLLVVGAAARARGHYTLEEFIEVCAWKTARSRPKVASNPEPAVVEATRRALASGDEAIRMAALLELEGVGVPTASTLLYFAFPTDYPILDVRALESLGVKPRSQYPLAFWLEYLGACRELAARNAVSIRTLDKALWQHSRERATPT